MTPLTGRAEQVVIRKLEQIVQAFIKRKDDGPVLRRALETSTNLLKVLHAAFHAAAVCPDAAKKSELDYWQPRDKANRIFEQIGYNESALTTVRKNPRKPKEPQ